MTVLFSIITIFIFISSYSCVNNLTYVLSYTNSSDINSLLRSNGLILTNTAYVIRLSSSSTNLVNSIQTLYSAINNVQSIVFEWNTGDCSYPSALATMYSTKLISCPICFSKISSLNNLLQLTVTTDQLGQAAVSFLNQYSLHYFSMILTDSNSFYLNLAEQFSNYLIRQSYIYDRFIPVSNFTSSSSISSLNSRG